MSPKHNHITKDVKKDGECPRCDYLKLRSTKLLAERMREAIVFTLEWNKTVFKLQHDVCVELKKAIGELK